MKKSIKNMKTRITKIITVLSLILLSATIVSCSNKDVDPKEPNKREETINGDTVQSEYKIISGEEYYERGESNNCFYFVPPDDISEPYCFVIPTHIDNMEVEDVCIGSFNYSNNAKVEMVELRIPDGIKFCEIINAPKLEKLVFADTVETITLGFIGEESEGLLDITWPQNKNLTLGLLFDIYNVEEFYFPDEVKEIEDSGICQSLTNCEKLKKIFFPKSMNKLGDHFAYNIDSMEKAVVPSGVTYIGSESFADCEKLSEITLPEGLLTIGKNSFSGLPSCDYIDIPDSVEMIGEGSFMDIIERVEDIDQNGYIVETGEKIYDNTAMTLGVGHGTYAEQYAKENGINYVYH